MKLKKCLKSVLLTFLFALALCAVPVCAKAAVFRSVPLSLPGATDEGQRDLEKVKIGRGYFWIRDYELYYGASKTAKGQKISNSTYSAVTDGNVIYFAETSRASNKATLYSYTVKNKKKKSIENISAVNVHVVGCVGSSVYMDGNDTQGYSVLRYNLKSKKTSKKTIEYRLDGMNSSYGKYTVGFKIVQDGNYTLKELYLHNLVTGKGKRIGKNGTGGVHLNSYFTKNKLFYEQVYYKKDSSTQQLNYKGTKIFSYDLKTGKEKSVTKMLKIYTITKLTSNSVTYMQEGTGKIKTVKFS